MSFWRHWNLISLLILLAGAAWIWASRTSPQQTTGGGIPAPMQGFQAPDFELKTLQGDSIHQ